MIWQNVTLSDPVTVKGLLFVRHIYDELVEERMTGIREMSIDAKSKIDDITDTYIVLDTCIDRIVCSDLEESCAKLYQMGYTEIDIAEKLNIHHDRAVANINRYCDKIVKENFEIWKEFIYKDKARVKDNYRQCKKCLEFKPETMEYYYFDKINNKFRERCKLCV